MSNSKNEKLEHLRQRAESAIKIASAGSDTSQTDEMKSVMHELQVYQTELEMQNEELRITQEELIKSRDDYARLYNDSPIGYVSLNHNRVIVQANNTFNEMVYTPKKFSSNMCFEQYIHPDDHDTFLSRYNSFFNKPEGKSFKLRLCGKDKTDIHVNIIGRSALTEQDDTNDNGKLLLLSIIDITAEVESKRLLDQSERKYQTLFDSSRDAIYLHGFSSDGKPDRFLDVNETACKMLGYSRGELLEKSPADIDEKKYRETQMPKITDKFLKDKEAIFEAIHVAKDGRQIPVEIGAHLLEIDGEKLALSTVRDISERKQAEEREKHIKQVLLAIRNVNQLITSEMDSEKLIVKACENLTETMGYHTAWITLTDDAGAIKASSFAGIKKNSVTEMQKAFRAGVFPSCVERVFEKEEFLVVENPSEECIDCPLADDYADCASFSHKLSFNGKLYGVLAVSVPKIYAFDAEQKSLFDEVADDLGFAFYKNENAEALKLANDIINSSPAAAFIWDNTEGWSVRFATENVDKLFGYTSDDFISGRISYAERVHPDDIAQVAQEVKDAVNNNITTFYHDPYRIITKSGDIRWVSDMTTIHRTETGEVDSFQGIVVDTTKQKLAEEAIKENERFLSTILQTTADGFWVLDNQGILRDVNNAYCAMTGYTRDELMGKGINDIDADENPEETKQRIQRIIKNGSEIFETNHRRKDGSIFPVEISTAFVEERGGHLICFCRDLTEKKNVLGNLYRKSLALNQISDIVTMTDLDGNIIYVNNAAYKMLDRNYDELIGQHISIFSDDPADGATQEEILEKTLKEGHWQGEIVNFDKNGNRIILSSRTQLIKDNGNNPIALCGISTDISDFRKIEEERAKASKLESIGLLAGGIAHDFNNILTSILGNTSLAKLNLDTKSEEYTLLSETEKATMRASKLTKQLLTFAKGGEPVKEVTNIDDILRETIRFTLRGSNINYRTSIARDLWTAEVDKGQFSQIISNLIINAKQAMPDGGSIFLAATNVEIEKKSNLLYSGKYLKISIKDKGPGIAEENQQKIFDPYFTTKQTGSGLGLTTAYSIIKRHKGHIEVSSEEGKGTTFTIYLPASLKKTQKENTKKIKLMDNSVTGNILVMDDEKSIQRFVEKILKSFGHTVTVVGDGVEAIQEYKMALKKGNPYDAVIMDLTIPGGMGGQETIKELISIDSDVKTIVSSGFSNNPVISNYTKYGFKEFIAKPYSIVELKEKLNKILACRKKDKT